MGLPYNAVAPSSHSNLSFRSFTHLSAMRQSVVQTGTIASCRSSTPLCVPSETFQLSKVDRLLLCVVEAKATEWYKEHYIICYFSPTQRTEMNAQFIAIAAK